MKELLLFGFNLSKIIAYQSFTNKMLKTILFFHAMFYDYFLGFIIGTKVIITSPKNCKIA